MDLECIMQRAFTDMVTPRDTVRVSVGQIGE